MYPKGSSKGADSDNGMITLSQLCFYPKSNASCLIWGGIQWVNRSGSGLNTLIHFTDSMSQLFFRPDQLLDFLAAPPRP